MKVIIIGGGKVGTGVGKILVESGCEIKIIENRENVIKQLQKIFPEAVLVEGDGADMSVLEDAGINDADVVAAVTGSDEVNLVATTIAKYEFGIKKVIGRVSNPKNDWLYTLEMGVDVKISQASMIATVIVDQINTENLKTLMLLNHGESSIISLLVNENSDIVGKQLAEVKFPSHTVPIAIQRDDENLVPRNDVIIKANDQILAYTLIADEAYLNKLVCKNS